MVKSMNEQILRHHLTELAVFKAYKAVNKKSRMYSIKLCHERVKIIYRPEN